MMRKKLGAAEKAPIERLEDTALKNTFGLMSCAIACLMVHLGINFVISFINFYEENTQANPNSTAEMMAHDTNEVWMVKGLFMVLGTVLILMKQK